MLDGNLSAWRHLFHSFTAECTYNTPVSDPIHIVGREDALIDGFMPDACTGFFVLVDKLERTSGSLSLNEGTAPIHIIGELHTANVSNTSPTAAVSNILTLERLSLPVQIHTKLMLFSSLFIPPLDTLVANSQSLMKDA
jgi:hypothetical protein